MLKELEIICQNGICLYFLISGEKTLMADVNITQGVCHVIHIFFGSSLAKVELPSFIIVGYV